MKKEYLETKGFIQVNLDVDNGFITNIKFYGDFLGTDGTEKLENKLIGIKFDNKDILKVLDEFDLKTMFGINFTNDDIINLIFK